MLVAIWRFKIGNYRLGQRIQSRAKASMMTNNPQQPDRSIPPFHETNADTPAIGGGLPVIKYWAEHTLAPDGLALWKTLLHKSACLSCSWGTGGQKGGFTNRPPAKVRWRDIQ